jgi:hypothetical protein
VHIRKNKLSKLLCLINLVYSLISNKTFKMHLCIFSMKNIVNTRSTNYFSLISENIEAGDTIYATILYRVLNAVIV